MLEEDFLLPVSTGLPSSPTIRLPAPNNPAPPNPAAVVLGYLENIFPVGVVVSSTSKSSLSVFLVDDASVLGGSGGSSPRSKDCCSGSLDFPFTSISSIDSLSFFAAFGSVSDRFFKMSPIKGKSLAMFF